MSAYESELTTSKKDVEEEDKPIPQSLFYDGMPETDRLVALNDLSRKLEEIRFLTVTQDFRSLKDLSQNKNVLDPGHDHIFPPKDRITVFTHFESLDSWTLGGTGTEVISSYVGGLILTTGAVANDTAFAQAITTGFNSFDVSQASTFQTSLRLSDTTSQTVYFGVGDLTGAAASEGYGFKVANGTLSSVTDDGAAGETLTTLPSTITLTNFNEYKAAFDGVSTVRFYVNGDLVSTHRVQAPNTDDDAYGTFFIQTTTTAARTLNAKCFFFSQQNT